MSLTPLSDDTAHTPRGLRSCTLIRVDPMSNGLQAFNSLSPVRTYRARNVARPVQAGSAAIARDRRHGSILASIRTELLEARRRRRLLRNRHAHQSKTAS